MAESMTEKFREVAHNAFRIAVGLMFFSHGAQKLFGWFGGVGRDGGAAELLSRFGVAGVLETFGGLARIRFPLCRDACYLDRS